MITYHFVTEAEDLTFMSYILTYDVDEMVDVFESLDIPFNVSTGYEEDWYES